MTEPLTCGGCGIGFRGRSDAIYCSSACRQKAHRGRTARRLAALADLRTPPERPERKVGKPEISSTIERAQREQRRARELCRAAADTMRLMGASQQAAAADREARASSVASSSHEGQ